MEVSIMTNYGKIYIDIEKLGESLGVPRIEMKNPSGKSIGLRQQWSKETLIRAVENLKRFSGSGLPVVFSGMCPSWVISAFAFAIGPCDFYLASPKDGTENPVPVLKTGEFNPAGDVTFKVERKEDKVYVQFQCGPDENNAHSYDESKVPFVVLPEIPANKHILLYGVGVSSAVLSMALGYAQTKCKSISIMFSAEKGFTCVMTNCDEIAVGDFEESSFWPNKLAKNPH